MCGCFMLVAGFGITVVAGYVFPPLGLIGIILMGLGWRALIMAGSNSD